MCQNLWDYFTIIVLLCGFNDNVDLDQIFNEVHKDKSHMVTNFETSPTHGFTVALTNLFGLWLVII